MKRIIPLFLICLFILSFCSPQRQIQHTHQAEPKKSISLYSKLVAAGVTLALKEFVSPLICDSYCSYPRSWKIIHNSLLDFVIPALKAKDPQILDINKWLEILINEGIDPEVSEFLTTVINLIMEFIPTEELKEYYNYNDYTKMIVTITLEAAETISNIITDCQLNAIISIEVKG
jgi:hypothetical protein